MIGEGAIHMILPNENQIWFDLILIEQRAEGNDIATGKGGTT